MTDSETRWVARLIPTVSASVDRLLSMPVSLDVWERHADSLIVVGSEAQLAELERRRLARVERIATVAEFERRATGRT
jgi:hypothetical protein